MEIILFVLLGLLSAWEEINQLVQRGSWQRDMFYSFLFWETAWNSKWKLFDSHHVAFGAFVLCLMSVLVLTDLHKYFEFLFALGITFQYLLQIVTLWFVFFYIRNLGLHIIFRKNVFRQWKYLLPIQKIGG